jgi:hypothetical protein
MLLINRFAVVSTGWKTMSSAIPAHPAPNTLAVFDSLLYTFADELVPAAACATFATASEGDGVIIENFEEGGN